MGRVSHDNLPNRTYLGFQLEMDELFGRIQKALRDIGEESGKTSLAEELILGCMSLNDEIAEKSRAFYQKRV